MANRDTFDFQKVDPDVPITMTLLFNRGTRDDGTKTTDDKTFDWHRYPVKVNGEEFTMFTVDERMHEVLQALDIKEKTDTFTITKKVGFNKETKKAIMYYEIEAYDKTLTTNGDTPPKTEKPAPTQEPKPTATPPAFEIKPLFEEVATAVWDTALDWVTMGMPEKPEGEALAQVKETIVKDCTTMVNTLIIQVNGKWNK